jgi:hypothetical protein
MRHKASLRLLLSLVFASGWLCAQPPWAGVLAPARAVDWTTAGSSSIATRTTICSTLNPGATASQINTAIANCPAEQVVKLTTGTYNLGSPGIVFNAKNSVTLRGDGPDKTKVLFSANGSCNGLGAAVCIILSATGWSQVSPGSTANWTAGYAKDATQITLSTVSGLAVGKLMVLDQTDDSSDDGSIYNCQTVGVCTSQGTDIGRSGRGQHQTVTVTAISGNVVTISPPLANPNWRSDRSPGAWWASSLPVSGVGIEDLSLDYSGISTGGHTYGMQFMGATNSWVKNIRSVNADNAHINFYLSTHITVRDSYFYGNRQACSQAYSMEPWLADSLLVENNIYQHEASPIVLSGSVGSVLAYNYATDDYFNCGDPAWFQSSLYHHEQGSNYNLWEGNIGPGMTADNIHGPSDFNTAFRNRLDGKDPLNTNTKTEQTIAVNLYSFNRFFNIIGNVLGTSGYHNTYEVFTTTTSSQSGSNCDTTIFRLGWGGNCSNSDNRGDPTLRTTLMRWGNYDTVNAAARFVSSEVPSGLSLYANPMPSSQTLPSSFYYAARPSWWSTSFGTPPWPAIGPDVTGGNIANVAGHANMNPAQLCYNNSPIDSSFGSNNVRVFNATSCYTASTPTAPQPPANLQRTIY